MKRKRALVIFAAVLVACGLVLGLTHQGRSAVKTAMLLPEILPSIPVKPLGWFTQAPVKETVYYSSGDRKIEATMYRPRGGGKHGAIILLLGVDPNLADPVFLKLVDGLAREGIVSLVPVSADLNSGIIGARDVDTLVDGFKYLESLDYVDAKRIGYAGFCIGASFSLLAAEDPRIADRVAFVNAFGAYFDATDLLVAISSKRIDYDGVHKAWTPNPLTVQVFTEHMLKALPDEAERALVRQALSEGADTGSQTVAALSPEPKAVYELLAGTDEATARKLLAQTPAAGQELLAKLSPKTGLAGLKTTVLIMVDTSDSYIPYVQSTELADALPASQRVYTEFSIFQHVSPQASPNPLLLLPDGAKLFRQMWLILEEVG